MKKQRSDAVLKTLPPGLQAEIFARCNMASYAVVREWLRTEKSVTTSEGALSKFFAWYPLSRRLEQAGAFSDSLKAQIAQMPALQGKAGELSDIAQIAFEMQAVQNQDGELFYNLRKLRLKEIDQRQNDRRIKLLEQKAAKADAAEKITGNAELSDAEKATQMRALFGMG
jgi:hypothetical protein